MPQVQIGDDVYARVLAFKPVVESVLEISLDENGYFELLLRLAPDMLIREFFGRAEAPALVQLLQQLGQAQPAIYKVLADVLEMDEHKIAEAERRAEVKQQLGFPEPQR